MNSDNRTAQALACGFMAAIFILAVVALTGCTHLRARAPQPLNDYNKHINAYFAGTLTADWLTDYNAMPEDTPAAIAAKMSQRNKILSQMIWVVDRGYDSFELAFYSNKATTDIAADWLGIGLGGWGGLAASAGTKSIIAIVSSGVSGANASIDARWFNNQTREALVSQMRANRAAQMVIINTLWSKPLTACPLERDIVAVQKLYQAGSLVDALQSISQSAGAQAVQNTNQAAATAP